MKKIIDIEFTDNDEYVFNLSRCPVCGECPDIFEDENGKYFVWCRDEDCPLNPITNCYDNIESAIREWEDSEWDIEEND